jgi:hypothetical protein
MADPATIAMVSMGSSALGGVTKAAGSVFSGLASSAMHKYQAGVAAVNAKIARQNAEYSRGIGEFKAEQSGMKTRAEIGKTTAIQGASGFRADTGSAADVRESQHMLGISEQNVIRSNAARAAYGHEVEALNFEAESQQHQMARKTSKIAGFLGAGESILGGASSVSSKWLQYQSTFG